MADAFVALQSESDSQAEVESVAAPLSDVDSGDADLEIEVEVPVSSLSFGAPAWAALVGLDNVELKDEFLIRACAMQFPPAFLRGLFRASMRFALNETDRARDASDAVALSQAWKLFLLLPRLLLHRPPRGGNIPKCRLLERFSDLREVVGLISWGNVGPLQPKLP